jgi:hypothetical protein
MGIDSIRKGITIIVGVGLSILLTILVMIYGWGLTPKSWWWIIGIGFFGQVFAQTIVRLGFIDSK